MAKNIHGAATQSWPAMGPKLEVARGENAGETFKVKFETKIGRERDNDVVLLDPKSSRYHAQITMEGGEWLLKDLGSANGTYLNEALLTAPTPLQTGDRVRLGETEMIFILPGRPQADTAPAQPVAATPPAATKESPKPDPAPAVQPRAAGQPKVAWVAAGLILAVCFVAVFVVYLIANRTGAEEAPAVNVASPTAAAGDPAAQDGDGQPAAATPASGQRPELVLAHEDDFSDSFGGWDDAFDTYTRKVYGNNRYQIEVNASNLVAWGLANRDVADFEVEVEARQEDGDVKNSYGLLFRFLDRENFYRFDISGDGFYLLSKFVAGEWITLVDWTESEAINQGNNASNILKVSAFGPEITVYVNGQQLAMVTDDSLSHGNFGFFAGTFAEPYTWVSFDNLKMWTPPNEEITLIPTATRPSAAPVAEASAPTATPVPPTVTATAEPEFDESEAAIEEIEEATVTPSPAADVAAAPTATPPPLPEYASRDQTLGRGEEQVSGQIVYPVYDTERGTYDIHIANVADGNNRELVQADASQPALTTDGTEIAYRSWQPDRRGLFARPLTGDDANAWGFDQFFESARPQFSPADNSLMYFSRTGGEAPAVYRVIDGIGQVMRRESFPIQGKSPKWGSEGQQFVYSSCLGSTCGIILGHMDGSAPVAITGHPSDTNPEISPDGSAVIFMSERAGNWEIYRVDIDGQNLKALTSDKSSDGLPTWAPDGSKIAFVSNRDGKWAVWTMDPDGSNKRRQFVLNGAIDGTVQHDVTNSYGWVEENIDWIP